jgi:hypothetical protein
MVWLATFAPSNAAGFASGKIEEAADDKVSRLGICSSLLQ